MTINPLFDDEKAIINFLRSVKSGKEYGKFTININEGKFVMFTWNKTYTSEAFYKEFV